MIFSFSEKSCQKINFEIDQTDIFCFFHPENAIKIPEKYWLQAVASSLKMKKNVLILEANLNAVPDINAAKRWQPGEHYLWLAPRSLSVLLEAPHAVSATYSSIKTHLKSFK